MAEDEPIEEVCRICHDNPKGAVLVSPCLCKGSMAKVHYSCLERWLAESGKLSCEICGHQYQTERRPRYTGLRSVTAWIRHPLNPADSRNLLFDLACFLILTPLAGISAWLCVVGAKHYNSGKAHQKMSDSFELDQTSSSNLNQNPAEIARLQRIRALENSNATWTSIGLLTLTGTLLAAYYVWLFVAIRYHIQVWREWKARNFIVTISPLNSQRLEEILAEREAAGASTSSSSDPIVRPYFPVAPLSSSKSRPSAALPKAIDTSLMHSEIVIRNPEGVIEDPVPHPRNVFPPPKKVQDINHYVAIPMIEYKPLNDRNNAPQQPCASTSIMCQNKNNLNANEAKDEKQNTNV